MDYTQHFLDEHLGGGEPDHSEPQILVQGDYVCIRVPEQPLHVYRATQPDEQPHPAVPRIDHNGCVYLLAWIEDDKW